MRQGIKRGLLCLAITPVAGLALVLPSSAHADVTPANISVQADGTLKITGNELANHITISPTYNNRVKIVDETEPIDPLAPDCVRWTDHEYDCGLSGPITGLYVNGREGNDVIVNLYPTNNINRAKLYGGRGDDTIYGGPGVQQVFGGLEPEDLRWNQGVDETGNDQLFGGCADACADGGDVIEGGPGNDSLDGGPGNDRLQGGPGFDTHIGRTGDRDAVSYADHDVSVKVSLNGIADDGPTGELENVPNDIEDIYGGYGNDTLIGNSAANVIHGEAGGDLIYGRDRNDTLYGESGYDQIFGDCGGSKPCVEGDDHMYGGTEDDSLIGSTGYDQATEYRNEGNDTCQARYTEGCERILQ
jgi:Ca2+-binding RTX toxin-like protein